ncbi:hypothetical protein [Alteromonas sp. C1M14]|uniref:hypothetical protein n=1 Tax=Alteromonas sp. C1M14 TaxID=2841567 RepID=UPI001C093765|nr:hypothetical protein [Alteromonas sp. C1M14]MBU2978365.1 hypothetical protein [Alteromonas sp. C1M14]
MSTPEAELALHRSWHRFKLGLMIFIAGATLLLTVAQQHQILYFLSIAILFIGFGIAMTGYLAILWQRLKTMNPAKKRDHPDE